MLLSMAKKTPRNKSSETKPMDPSDFGDLGPIEPAPDEAKPKAKAKPEPDPEPAPLEPEKPKGPTPEELANIVLSPDDVLKALKAGDWSGLPAQKGLEPKLVLDGGEIVLISQGQKITANISGHACECYLTTETRLSNWKVIGSVKDLSGKWRLNNDIRMAHRGQVIELKKGKEFYDHQLSVEEVRQAGGIVLPIGTQK